MDSTGWFRVETHENYGLLSRLREANVTAMKQIKDGVKSRAEQSAERLKRMVMNGLIGPDLPSVEVLAVESGVSPETMRQGLRILEREGVLINHGPGRRRQVNSAMPVASARQGLRVAMLTSYGRVSMEPGYRELLDVLEAKIQAMGHRFEVLPFSQQQLGYDTRRIVRRVEKTRADLWLVESGSAALLRWFADRPEPVFAVGGEHWAAPGIPAAGSHTGPVVLHTVRRLCELGHRRIVSLQERNMRRSVWYTRHIHQTLEEFGIKAGPYNVPDWEETPDGLNRLLESMFRISPPTALLVHFPAWMYGVLSFLARRGLKSPRDVSLVCGCDDPGFRWCLPSIAFFRHDDNRMLRVLLAWVRAVADGRVYAKTTRIPVKLVEGGTIGRAVRTR